MEQSVFHFVWKHSRSEQILLSLYRSVPVRDDATHVLTNIRREMREKTLIASLPENFNRSAFDQTFAFDGPRLQVHDKSSSALVQAAGAPVSIEQHQPG